MPRQARLDTSGPFITLWSGVLTKRIFFVMIRIDRSGSRRRNISHARAVIAKRCTEEIGMTFADIARCLGYYISN